MAYLRNSIYLVLLFLLAPVLLFRVAVHKKYREGWAAKFLGRAPGRASDRPCVWFHAVSVGEVKLLRPLIREFTRKRPDWEVVVSTTTATGLAVARRDYPDLLTFYAPLDFSWAVRRALRHLRPTILAFVELELWPNWIEAAHCQGARVVVVNARLSKRSFRGYRRLGRLLRPTLRQIDLVAAQTDEYARRFIELGVDAARVPVTGSVKYDGLETDRANPKTLALRKAFGISGADVVFVAGSTMEGEEGAALEAYRAARGRHHRLRLILVPRHPERFDAVAAWLRDQGELVWRRSQSGPAPKSGIILVDTVGELSAVWGLADIAFVGGSLFPGRGGQNMMEPAAYAASVLFGPHTDNFQEATEGLLTRAAAVRVRSAEELRQALQADLEEPESAHARGQAARRFVLAQQGASLRTAMELDRLAGGTRHSERMALSA